MDLSQVTLAQMRYAVAVYEAKNFRRAAGQCHVSQSGLSMQIQKLEDLLGVVLFDRGKKPVLVTPEGEPVIAHIQSILRETERLGQLVADQTGPAGPFRLGVIPTLSSTVLPLFLPDFVKRYPAVELAIEELKTEEIIARLQMDTLDGGLAATPLRTAGLREHVLGKEAMFAYLPIGDPLLKKKAITQHALRDRQLWVMPEGHCFRSQVLSYCEPTGRAKSGPVQFESGSFQTLIRLVDEGMGATVLPALVVEQLSASRKKQQVRPLVSPTPVREVALVTARTDLRRRVIDVLAETIEGKLSAVLGEVSRRALVLDPM